MTIIICHRCAGIKELRVLYLIDSRGESGKADPEKLGAVTAAKGIDVESIGVKWISRQWATERMI